MNNESVIDTFLSRIKINNNSFNSIYHAIEFFSNNLFVPSQPNLTSNFPLVVINCSDNYYNRFDSLSIDSLVFDSRDPLDTVYVNIGMGNLAYFDYTPWSDTLITRTYAPILGIRYNNFIDCETVFYSGVIEDTTTVLEKEPFKMKNSFSLVKTYPNPFNSQTKVQFYLPEKKQVKFSVFDISGKIIDKLTNTKTFFSGTHEFLFNFEGLTSGIYVIKISTGEWSKSAKVIYLK